MAIKYDNFGYMTTTQMQKVQKIAKETAAIGRRALRKSNELEAYLSLLEYREGRVNFHASVKELLRKVRRA